MKFFPSIDIHFILLAGAMGCLSSYLAYRRGRNPFAWFAVGFLFGLIGIFAFLFFVPPPKKKRQIKDVATPSLKPIPQPYLFGPADKFWYYLDEAHNQVGPMSHQGITNAWKEGTLSHATFVWHEDMIEWQPLQEVVRTQE